MYFFYRSFLDKMWPRTCISCPSELEYFEEWLCSTCLDRLWEAQIRKNSSLPSCDSAQAWLDFDAVQGCMHQLKFGERPELGHYLGRLYAQMHERPAVEALIPLPLSTRRQRQRGYNQCTWICHGLAEVWDLPVWTHVLTKAHRPPQAQQNKAQRAVAMEGAFAVPSPLPMGCRIQLWDDTWTTGATLNAAAWALRDHGAREVHARAIASE